MSAFKSDKFQFIFESPKNSREPSRRSCSCLSPAHPTRLERGRETSTQPARPPVHLQLELWENLITKCRVRKAELGSNPDT